jgi:prepilin-type N-terminal cleavage/methylation domain-containing protein
MLSTFRPSDRSGFTLMEVIIAVAVVAIMAGALTPLVIRHLDSAKLARAQNETETIGAAVLQLYKDTGYWPITRANGPGGTVARLLSSSDEAAGSGSGAQSGARNWSTHGSEKQMGDFLYWNNPDDNSSATGTGRNEANQDYPTTGPLAWKGPYLPNYTMNDPWGHAYVMNVRYLPGGIYGGTVRHKVFVLSAGPNGKWETGYNDGQTEEITGDDIGTVVYISR